MLTGSCGWRVTYPDTDRGAYSATLPLPPHPPPPPHFASSAAAEAQFAGSARRQLGGSGSGLECGDCPWLLIQRLRLLRQGLALSDIAALLATRILTPHAILEALLQVPRVC
jgi:hypothetical protein